MNIIARAALDTTQSPPFSSLASGTVAHNLWLIGQLRTVVQTLGAHGADCLSFKGPVLVALAYPNFDRAPSNDLDLLVNARDVPGALTALGTLGYTPKSAAWRAELPGMNEVALRAPGRAEVDLHWQLSPVYFARLKVEDAFARRRTVRLAGQDVDTLGNEDCFVGLAIHHARHGWPDSSWVRDLVGFVDHQPVDWSLVSRIARDSSAQRVVRIAILLLDSAARGRVPASILHEVERDRTAVALALTLRRDFGRYADPPASLRGVWRHLQMLDRFSDRVRYVSRRLLLPNHLDLEELSERDPSLTSLRTRRIRRLISRSAFGLFKDTQ